MGLKEIYDKKYLNGYRKSLSGYEVARYNALQHFITKFLRLKKNDNILDYGCGNGLYLPLWKSIFKNSEIYCADISPVAIEQCKLKYNDDIKTLLIKDNTILVKDNYFDLILSIEVMEHVTDLSQYLMNIKKLLKKGGYFVWTTPCANNFSIEHIYSKCTNKIILTKEGFRKWEWEDKTHIRRLKSKEIKETLHDFGFKNVKFRYRAHFFSFFVTYIFNKVTRGKFNKFSEKMMLLDYSLFRMFPNGASMIGVAKKE